MLENMSINQILLELFQAKLFLSIGPSKWGLDESKNGGPLNTLLVEKIEIQKFTGD
jgi:hypothetical protein